MGSSGSHHQHMDAESLLLAILESDLAHLTHIVQCKPELLTVHLDRVEGHNAMHVAVLQRKKNAINLFMLFLRSDRLGNEGDTPDALMKT